jgi:hypothetical protein
MKQDTAQASQALNAAVSELLKGLPTSSPTSPDEIDEKIASLAELVVHARTHIRRDGHKKEIRYVPEPEAPTRLSQQLAQLAKGSAILDRRDEVSEEDYRLVCRVAMDCIPQVRRRILEYLSTGDESKVAGLPASTRSYADEELEALGLVTNRGGNAELSLKALSLMSTACLI